MSRKVKTCSWKNEELVYEVFSNLCTKTYFVKVL